jgi:hypothetical protein
VLDVAEEERHGPGWKLTCRNSLHILSHGVSLTQVLEADVACNADQRIVNTIEVIAVDSAGNRSVPATVTVDCSQGWCQ